MIEAGFDPWELPFIKQLRDFALWAEAIDTEFGTEFEFYFRQGNSLKIVIDRDSGQLVGVEPLDKALDVDSTDD